MDKAKVAFLVVLILLLYFLPAVIAHARRHRQIAAITLINLLLGWTGLGWVLVFFWSWSPNVKLI
jgi:hypothetical protein